MNGLLLKDFYMIRKYYRLYLLMVLCFIAVAAFSDNNSFFVVYPTLFTSILPVGLISLDEKSKWNAYCGTLPCSRKQIVSEKYALSLITLAVLLVLTGISQTARMIMRNELSAKNMVSVISSILVIGIISPSIMLPIIYKLGVEKGRIAYLIIIASVCAGSTALSVSTTITTKLSVSYSIISICALTVLSLLIFIASWFISVRVYSKKDL